MRLGVQGDGEIYEAVNVSEDTKVLVVKEDIKYKVALAGMLKGGSVTLEEADDLLEKNKFDQYGIYVNKNSQEKFMNLINEFVKGKYEFDSSGYLKIVDNTDTNENDKKLIKMIESKRLYIFEFSPLCYIVDDVSGEVVDYPFEDMDPYQVYQSYRNADGSKEVIFITTNIAEKLNNQEIFEEITAIE